MITPRFHLNQDESTVTFNIRAPYCNLREIEVTVEENVFIFLASPYYLRLHLPGNIVENDLSKSSFDADSGEFSFTFEKTISGEHFPDLDLITKLLCPKLEVSTEDDDRKITVLTNGELPEVPDELLNEEFGFALAGKRNFHSISAEFQDVFEIDPREVCLNERHKMRVQYDQTKFNTDHYLSDYIENDEILEVMALESPWSKLTPEDIQFTDKELDFLKDLPNKQHNLSETQINYCHCSLLDILFAYCYDRRTTYFEGSSESGWTIIKLAASFSWLEAFTTPKEAIVCAVRRSLIYPLYRNFDLSQTIFVDLKQLLQLGEKFIIRCLIEIYDIFLKGDCCRYILNDLFVKDYIIYVMKWEKSKWKDIVTKVDILNIGKNDLGLNLAEIEDNVAEKLMKLSSLNINDDDSDDTEENEYSSCNDSDTETSCDSDSN